MSDLGKAVVDGWENTLTGLSTYSKDKRERATIKAVRRLDDQELADLYNGNWLVRKIIEKPIKAALSKGWELVDDNTDLTAEYERLDFQKNILEVYYWDRLYGGALLVIGAEGGGEDLSLPLPNNAKGVRYLQPIPRSWVQIIETEGGSPTLFRITPREGAAAYVLHASRCVFLDGGTTTPDLRVAFEGWGQSILIPLLSTLRDFLAAYDGAFVLTQDFSQTIYGMSGLAEALGSNNASVIKNRLQMMDLARSIVGAVVVDVDGGETFERKTTSVAGLGELLTKIDYFLAAAADMPGTELFGASPNGMNASGDGERSTWHARLEEEQRHIGLTIQTVVSRILGKPARVSFPPLQQLSEAERADVHLKQSQADALNITNGLMTPQEGRDSRFGGEKYSTHTTIDDSTTGMDLLAMVAELEAEGAAPLDQPKPPEASAEVSGDKIDKNVALNGAQVTAMLDVIERVSQGAMTKITGVKALSLAFDLDVDKVTSLMAEVDEGTINGEDNNAPDENLVEEDRV